MFDEGNSSFDQCVRAIPGKGLVIIKNMVLTSDYNAVSQNGKQLDGESYCWWVGWWGESGGERKRVCGVWWVGGLWDGVDCVGERECVGVNVSEERVGA